MKWFAKRPAVPERPPLDPALAQTVERVTSRALTALERGDEITAEQWIWALFNTSLRKVG